MKKLLLSTIIFCSALFITSCDKDEDEGKLPNISFKSGGGYTSANKTVGLGDTVIIGIQASKAEDKDVLKTFDASVNYDNTKDSSIINESLSGGNGDNYGRDITVVARNKAGIEKYTFTVINRDGLKNSVSLALNVQ